MTLTAGTCAGKSPGKQSVLCKAYAACGGRIRLEKCGSQQIISVSDNGVGVPPEKLSHVFERFYRCDEARSREGSGIGLYIVKYIVEAHGGQVQAVNDNGLTIRMSFPERTKQDEENTDRRG